MGESKDLEPATIRTGFEKGRSLRDEDVRPTVILLKVPV
jgi:hypothetical protein